MLHVIFNTYRTAAHIHLGLSLILMLIFMFNINSFYRTVVSELYYWFFLYENNLKENLRLISGCASSLYTIHDPPMHMIHV